MNEVTKIHLGRQALSIASDAHKDLRDYLAAIKHEVKDDEVMEEIELRMAELLAHRGVTGSKVILAKDVGYLKSQLGDPLDFKDEEPTATTAATSGRHLFRDTRGAMLAGVSAGLANYFGLDVLIIRILFIIGIFTGGWGILVYGVLWVLVPEAKTSSDRLQMAGKPVNLTSLKEIAERTDVIGAAKRANNSLIGPVNRLFRLILSVLGLTLIVVGLGALSIFTAAIIYVFVHTGNLLGQDIFPVGLREHLILSLGIGVLALLAIMLTVCGAAIFKQKWPIKAWVSGVLVGLTLIGLVVTLAFGADAAPRVRARYNAHLHTTARILEPFTSVTTTGNGISIRYEESDQYAVSLKYFDDPDVANIKTTVGGGTLLIDSSQFNWHRNCPTICLPNEYNVVVTINAPSSPEINGIDNAAASEPPTAPIPAQ